jgi:hypothetical protein
MGGGMAGLRGKLGMIRDEMNQLRNMEDQLAGEVNAADLERGSGRERVVIQLTNHINAIDRRGVKEFVEQEMTEILLTNLELRYGERLTTLVENSRDAIRRS